MAEAETGLAGLKWVVSSILCDTLKQGYANLERDVPQEIEDLERKLLPRLKSVIEAAQKSPNEIRVKKWLEKLKFALYDVEDLLVEHEYGCLKHQINGNRCCECLPAHPLIETLQNLFDTLSRKVPENKRLLKQLENLKNTATEGSTFFKFLGKEAGTISGHDGITSLNTRTSMPDSEIFVREMEQEAIVSHILESNGNDPQSSTTRRFSVFGIVGNGGLGKTTLAHHIFDDERLQDYFNIRMWVNMSLKLDNVQHTKEMINSAFKEKCQQASNLENLQKELRKMLNKRDRILLVLDNVWWNQSDGDQWESMLDPFRHYANNVTVLLTSRSENLPHPLLPAQIVSLIGLEKDKLSSLFFNYAFNNSENIDPNKRKTLESISDDIIPKFGGSPMTAKFVGIQLGKNKNAIFWRGVASNENLSGTMESLMWSFQQLDERLQRCFLYCGIFPKGYTFVVSDLVQLWIGEGFVRNEDKGELVFYELLSAGFFQISNGSTDCKLYKMHDLVHDLAEVLSKGECIRIEDDKVIEIPCTTRYLSVLVENIGEHKLSIAKLKNLHTLIFLKQSTGDLDGILDELLIKLRKLRVLHLNGGITVLSEHAGDIKHLRYLNLASTTITELPDSICKLYNLQLLKLNSYIGTLPNYITHLVKLRYLEAYDNTNQITIQTPWIPYIGRLTLLKQLEEFHIRKVDGYNLGQLGNLNELQGTLKLKNLENVETKEEATEACLSNKKNIEELHLLWGNNGTENLDLEAETIESVRLPPNLKRLTIKKYKNVKFPSWVLDQSVIENLEYLYLSKCDAIEAIPDNIGLSASSFEVFLEKLWNLRILPTLPTNTSYVRIECCPLLVFVGTDEFEAGFNQMNSELKQFVISRLLSIILTMPQGDIYMNKVLLREWRIIEEICKDEEFVEYLSKSALDISDDEPPENNRHYALQEWWRSHLQRVNYIYSRSNPMHLLLPSNITKLELEACNITDDALYECMAKLIWLTHLKLSEIMTITTLPLEIAMQSLISLRELIIEKCWCLTSLGGIGVVTSLKTLYINFCPCLSDDPVLPKSIEEITVKNSYLSDGFISGPFPFLRITTLECCRGLPSISISHSSALEKLVLYKCPDLYSLEGLLDRPLLKHVELMYLPKLVPGSFTDEGFGIVHLQSLEVLKVSGCDMSSLGPILKSLSSLQRLELFECWGITALPEMPESLETIQIEQWPELTSRCQELYGEDWPKIAHVPERLIW
ncbi:Rp1-like protein [Rhynchospora pubera]|uniref:Rp1-like protein n=1 Tax=Rhynchospora pubera TaxID=906938 RepID=A0AAV8HSA2_9POAL|nr:Rp1-like protein [Rhynchospora pubera]